MKSNEQIANKVSVVTIIWNCILSLFKLIVGIISNSNALISDSIHSASDVFSTFIVIIGIRIAAKEPDKEHPYGHERMECAAAIILSVTLFITGLSIGINAFKNIIDGSSKENINFGILAIIITVISIVVKELMYWYTIYYAKKIDSGALMADAWHHRSDSLSSIGALVGIIGANLGYSIMDSLASLVIFGFIAKASYDIFKDALDKMVDKSCDDSTEEEICKCILKNREVLGIDMLQTRIFGNKIYVDLEILLDGTYTLNRAHTIAEEIHDDIEKNFPKIKHIMVHVNSAT